MENKRQAHLLTKILKKARVTEAQTPPFSGNKTVMKAEIVELLEKEINPLSAFLKEEIASIEGVTFRREQHIEVSKREYIFEYVVMKYVNEDDYGPSLIMSLELKESYELDLSVIRGYGEILHQRIIAFTGQSIVDLIYVQLFMK